MRLLPGLVRRKAGLDDPAARGSRKVEIGSGPFPRKGYIHVDVDPTARHLEAFAPAWDLPFPDGWASEILAVHSLEHVHPRKLLPALREWHRVLAPGGRVQVHVPNAPELTQSFFDSPVDEKWRTMGALLGMYCHPGVRSPDELEVPSDHQLMFDWEMLSWVLTTAGFSSVVDLTERTSDSHTEAWRGVVPHFSLVAEAVRPG
ncbi:MAG: methyltransferase domain-containing protein [Actinomycetota bacterium]|nr:methyltransferase domain-containing protein [Actinomycetota bacterium]